ncbi:DUF4336 domain-containing protein [Pyxidicoccus sp. 3LFB2]
MLRPVAEDVYVFEVPFRFAGLEVGGRMTVVRLPDGGLWVHSPVRLTPEARAAVDALGPVRFLVAPNLMHHLFVQDWAAAYPEAKVAAPPRLRHKRPDLRIDIELGDGVDRGWARIIDQAFVRGMPKLDECIFFHRPSRTVLITDLAFNVHRADSWRLRAYLKLSGAWQRLAMTLTARMLIRHKPTVREVFSRVRAWDAERVVVCHGDVVEKGGREALANAFPKL